LIKDYKKLPYDKKKQALARKNPPQWTIKDTYSKSQELFFCNKCGDTSFELLDNDKQTGKCCRCGLKYAS